MADGTRIQERDLSNIFTTRRPLLADISGRLGYMERQGSGFKKITESYRATHNFRDELEQKFYSDAGSFQVTLYNLNYVQTTEKAVVSGENQLFDKQKAVVSDENQLIETLLLGLKTKLKPKKLW